MDQQRRSAPHQDMAARPRHGHSRARITARTSHPSAAGEQRGPVIVVGYDATPEARAALAYAVRRARPYGSVVAVHAGLHPEIVQAAVLAAGVETALLEGRPAEVLARIAEHRDASAIVVGSPKPGRARTLIGSRIVRKLVASAGRPVVVVPATPAR